MTYFKYLLKKKIIYIIKFRIYLRKIKHYSSLIMELMVDILLLVKGEVSLSIGNLFQVTIERG